MAKGSRLPPTFHSPPLVWPLSSWTKMEGKSPAITFIVVCGYFHSSQEKRGPTGTVITQFTSIILFNFFVTMSCITVYLGFYCYMQIITNFVAYKNVNELSHGNVCQESGNGLAGSSAQGLTRLKSAVGGGCDGHLSPLLSSLVVGTVHSLVAVGLTCSF